MDDIRDGHPRVEYAEDNSIKLNNWVYYQSRPPEEEVSPRLRSALEKEALTRKMVNEHPEAARDTLAKDLGDTIIDKNGEFIAERYKGVNKNGDTNES